MSEATLERRQWTDRLWSRWPTAAGVALAAFVVTSDSALDSAAELVPLLALEYLLVAKLGRREATWPVIAGLSVVIAVVMVLDVVPLPTVVAAIAVIVLVWSAVDRQLFRSGEFRLQALGMVGFGALTLMALAVEPDVARYIVAAAWLLHGVWDFVHLWRDKVVSRSYAEWCGVADVLVAFGLVLLV
jgi:hypothetical protein